MLSRFFGRCMILLLCALAALGLFASAALADGGLPRILSILVTVQSCVKENEHMAAAGRYRRDLPPIMIRLSFM